VSESEAVRGLRRQLGQRLAAARKDAGLKQREFAQRISYSRSTLSTIESGVQRGGRAFWQACDRVLGTSRQFEQGYDRIHAQQVADRADRPPSSAGIESPGVRAGTAAEAEVVYRALGWRIEVDGKVAQLVTGTALDALEVPRAAGLLAASWWQGTNGSADPIRGLPALPDPQEALAVISCGQRCFFLAAAGSFVWAGLPVTAASATADMPAVRWHSDGSRIPVPPGTDPDGQLAAWAFLPTRRIELASAVMLLDLLGKAAAAAGLGRQALALPGSVLVVPAGPGSPGDDPPLRHSGGC
jgi:hypothetical protein